MEGHRRGARVRAPSRRRVSTSKMMGQIIKQTFVQASTVKTPVNEGDLQSSGVAGRSITRPPNLLRMYRPRSDDDYLGDMRKLILIMTHADKLEESFYLGAYLSFMASYSTDLYRTLIPELSTYGYEAATFQEPDEVWDANDQIALGMLEEEEDRRHADVNNNIIDYLYGINSCLLGKNLTSASYDGWMEKRERSLNKVALCGSYEAISDYRPSRFYCEVVYQQISVMFGVRKAVFQSIYKIAGTQNSAGHTIAKASLRLLQGAEISNFMFIQKYILIENPILLAWQELAKYAPFLITAARKYQMMGEMAPFCKFLLDQDQLTEFNRNNLTVPFAIAKAIAERGGNSSTRFLQGNSNDPQTQIIVTTALELVEQAGGANTKVTKDVRRKLLPKRGNRSLINMLNTGATVREDDTSTDDDEDEENDE